MLMSCNSRPPALIALPHFCAGDLHYFADEISRLEGVWSQENKIRNAAWFLYLEDAGLT